MPGFQVFAQGERIVLYRLAYVAAPEECKADCALCRKARLAMHAFISLREYEVEKLTDVRFNSERGWWEARVS
jgi:hypothetical protein